MSTTEAYSALVTARGKVNAAEARIKLAAHELSDALDQLAQATDAFVEASEAAASEAIASEPSAPTYALPYIPERPSYQLQVDDPAAFAEQMDAHERALAQHEFVTQQIAVARSQTAEVDQMLAAQGSASPANVVERSWERAKASRRPEDFKDYLAKAGLL